jgi:trimeric autotransporter adhesin
MIGNRQAGAIAALAVAGLLGGCAATSSGQQAQAGKSASAASSSAASSSAASAKAAVTQTDPRAGASSDSPAPRSAAGATSTAGCQAAGASAGAVGSPGPALSAVQFTDAAHGWVAGAGRILATSDGGRSWNTQYSGSADLDQVDFTDAAHGWAVGQGALLRTADGGASWTGLSEPRVGGHCLVVDSVHFVSAARGYAIAAPVPATAASTAAAAAAAAAAATAPGTAGTPAAGGRLLATTDGGATWNPLPGAPAGAQSACFGSAHDGYVGTPGRIWRTTDAGMTWALAFTEPRAAAVGQAAGNPSAGDTPELQCAGQQAAWVLFLGNGAAMMHAPYLAYATGQGTEWHGVLEETMLESALRPKLHLPAGPGSEPGPFSAISASAAAFVGYTPPEGFGAAPVALASGGGATLTSAGNVPAINEPLAAAFLTPAKGWVVGENLKSNTFTVEATSDGGHSWATQYTTH